MWISGFWILKSRNQGLPLLQGHPMVNIYSLGVNILWTVSADYHFLPVCYSLFLPSLSNSTSLWKSQTHSNNIVPRLPSLIPLNTLIPLAPSCMHTPLLPELVYKHSYVFSTTLPRLGKALLGDEIFRATVTFLVVRLRVNATWKNTAFFLGELLCQRAVNAAEGCSPGPVKGSIKGMIWNVRKNQ